MRRNHPRQMRRATRTRNHNPQPPSTRLLPIRSHQIRRPMRRNHPLLIRHIKRIQNRTRLLHHRPITITAHYHAHQRMPLTHHSTSIQVRSLYISFLLLISTYSFFFLVLFLRVDARPLPTQATNDTPAIRNTQNKVRPQNTKRKTQNVKHKTGRSCIKPPILRLEKDTTQNGSMKMIAFLRSHLFRSSFFRSQFLR